jgi:glycerol-3-phosphate dehydrogenase (NAD(P)+)
MAYAVIGAGSWGTALATHLARRERVRLWCRRESLAQSIRDRRESPYFPSIQLPATLEATHRLGDALSQVDGIVLAIPTQALRGVLTSIDAGSWRSAELVLANKGIERGSLLLPSAIVAHALGDEVGSAAVTLAGPSFATEVVHGSPTVLTAAHRDEQLALRIQARFSFGTLRVYRSTDRLGVELAGALKNVVAIAAGVVDGLGTGHNTSAALITRGLAEIARLGVALGARRETFMGIAGLGDLVLTCTGSLSRNRELGRRLAQGESLQQIIASSSQVAEGVETCAAACELGHRVEVDLPIISQVHAILFERKTPHRALLDLLARPLRPEDDVA